MTGQIWHIFTQSDPFIIECTQYLSHGKLYRFFGVDSKRYFVCYMLWCLLSRPWVTKNITSLSNLWLEYFQRMTMPRLLVSPRHRQLWYCPYRMVMGNHHFSPDTITLSNKNRGILIQPHIHCLFNSLIKLTSNITFKLRITGPLWGESIDNRWLTLTKGP